MRRSRFELTAEILIAFFVWAPLCWKGLRRLGDETDFTIYLDAARRLLAWQAIYDGEYMYPPLLAFLLTPFALLPGWLAGALWLLAKIPLCAWSAHRLLTAGPWSARQRRIGLALAPLLIYRFLDSDLTTGNSNVYVLAGCVLGFAFAAQGRAMTGGLLLAAASAIKLAPLYLVAAAIANRSFRFALASSCALLVFLALPFLGCPEGPHVGLREFNKANTAAILAVDEPVDRNGSDHDLSGYVAGQSLRAFLHRILRPIDASAHDGGEIVAINWCALSGGTVEWIYRILAVLGGGLCIWAMRHRSWRWTIAFACAVLLWLVPYARKGHFVLLLPGYLLMVETLLTARLERKTWIWLTVISSWMLGQLSTSGVWGKPQVTIILSYCPVGWAAVALAVALWWIPTHHSFQEPDRSTLISPGSKL
ncbi:MAG: glycosyltransferase family 87 protein [Planctomycetota bacterium]